MCLTPYLLLALSDIHAQFIRKILKIDAKNKKYQA
jgi:hypothetical protein